MFHWLSWLCSDLKAEKEFLELTTTEERCVVHFYHVDFRRCDIMDKHLKVSRRQQKPLSWFV